MPINPKVLSGKVQLTAEADTQLATDEIINGPLMIRAASGNGSAIFIGNDGLNSAEVSGFELSPGEAIVFDYVGNLNRLYAFTANANDLLYWIRLND